MSFFERYFAALDGPDPHSSLELVAENVEFSIQWARGTERASRQLLGGRAGDVEFALGETRYDSGERIGTFLAVAQLDGDGRMTRYMVARSPALAFEPARIDAG